MPGKSSTPRIAPGQGGLRLARTANPPPAKPEAKSAAPTVTKNPHRGKKHRKHSRRNPTKNPKRNPSMTTWLVGGGVVLVGAVTGALVWRSKRKKAALPPGGGGGGTTPGGGGGGTTPGGGGGGSGSGKGTYVDSTLGPYSWPHKDIWPTNMAIGVQMEALGYDMGNVNAPDWNMIRNFTMAQTKQFQKDYNVVRGNWQALGLSPSPDAPVLAVDAGLMGTNTVNALYDAMRWSATKPWQTIVSQARNM